MATLLDEALVTDSLGSLPGWQGDSAGIWREVRLSPDQTAELRRQIGVDAGAMGHEPELEDVDGGLRIVLRTPESGGVTELDVTLASHISDLVHRIEETEPGVKAVREGDPVVVVRTGESAEGDTEDDEVEGPMIGVASVTGGTAPRVPLPDEEPYAPEPGVSTEQTQP